MCVFTHIFACVEGIFEIGHGSLPFFSNVIIR
jgi:hypothetical protein